MRYAFPANVDPDEDGFMVRFDNLSGVTWGGTRDEALREAQDLLISCLTIAVRHGEACPRPGEVNGRPMVSVTILESAKLALHDTMVAQGLTASELARRLGIDEKAVRRLRDPLHGSKIEAVETALRHRGLRAEVEYQAAA